VCLVNQGQIKSDKYNVSDMSVYTETMLISLGMWSWNCMVTLYVDIAWHGFWS